MLSLFSAFLHTENAVIENFINRVLSDFVHNEDTTLKAYIFFLYILGFSCNLDEYGGLK